MTKAVETGDVLKWDTSCMSGSLRDYLLVRFKKTLLKVLRVEQFPIGDGMEDFRREGHYWIVLLDRSGTEQKVASCYFGI